MTESQAAAVRTIVEAESPLRPAPLSVRLASLAAVRALGLFAATWRFEILDGAILDDHMARGCCVAFWHGRALVPAWRYRHRRVIVMVSFHQDGEIMNRSLARLGYIRVRGSTSKGGREALSAIARLMQQEPLTTAITPDGPHGPPHHISPGVVMLASRTGRPIIPCGVGARSRWHLKSWDKYMIPKPFTKVRMAVGEPIYVPKKLRRPVLDGISTRLREELIAQERRAEAFGGAGEGD